MEVYTTRLRSGITRSKEFERKRLASFAVNVGTKCGHGCSYCSTGAVLRMNRSFKEAGRSPFESGYAIVDPDTPDRVAADGWTGLPEEDASMKASECRREQW